MIWFVFFGWTRQKVGIVHVKRRIQDDETREKTSQFFQKDHSQAIPVCESCLARLWRAKFLSSGMFKWSFESLQSGVGHVRFSRFQVCRAESSVTATPSRTQESRRAFEMRLCWEMTMFAAVQMLLFKVYTLAKVTKDFGVKYSFGVASVFWVWVSWADSQESHFWTTLVIQHGRGLFCLRSTPPTKTTKDGKMPRCDRNWCGQQILYLKFFRNGQWGGCFLLMILGWVKMKEQQRRWALKSNAATIHNILPLSRMSKGIDVYSHVFYIFWSFMWQKPLVVRKTFKPWNYHFYIFNLLTPFHFFLQTA